jgi:pimeloyl-ACP methyl ester carboxylesterase
MASELDPVVSDATLVLVHGGQHTGACWQPTVDVIARRQPHRRVIAVDLPGRASQPGDLATLTISQCVESVVSQIGDSCSGEVVLVACCVPPQGKTVVDTLRPPVSWITGVLSKRNPVSKPLPPFVAKWMFANGMSKELRQLTVEGLVSESSGITREPVDRRGMPKVPTTWLLTKRDNSLRPARQREFAANLGSVDEIIEIDTCHNAMMSEPELLADLLLERC